VVIEFVLGAEVRFRKAVELQIIEDGSGVLQPLFELCYRKRPERDRPARNVAILAELATPQARQLPETGVKVAPGAVDHDDEAAPIHADAEAAVADLFGAEGSGLGSGKNKSVHGGGTFDPFS
jgi:hypothetical protein